MHSATGWSICGTKREEIMLEIFMILSFKKSPFWPFLLEKLSKIHKIGDFGCKNHQN